jgi:hypothetical protein
MGLFLNGIKKGLSKNAKPLYSFTVRRRFLPVHYLNKLPFWQLGVCSFSKPCRNQVDYCDYFQSLLELTPRLIPILRRFFRQPSHLVT